MNIWQIINYVKRNLMKSQYNDCSRRQCLKKSIIKS